MSKKPVTITACIFMTLLMTSCSVNEPKEKTIKEPSKYQVKKLAVPMAIDANWDKPQWQKVEPLDIKLFMGDKPQHQPKVQAKVLYDSDNIYVIFRTEDKYVRAIATEYDGAVWEDSCVEFFFTPGGNISEGYFNLETNCIGTILLRYQLEPDENQTPLKHAEIDQVEIAHSLPRKVLDSEITEPTTWTLEYRIPFKIIEKYTKVTRPAPGVVWRANFYKCGDKTSYPHWLTWSLVENDTPNFHLPEYFGIIEFIE